MSRPQSRTRLESGYKLTLNGMKLKPRSRSQVNWTFEPCGGTFCGVLRLEDTQGELTLSHDGGYQTLDLVAVPRPFGGVHWYLICPATGRRCLVLWKPPGTNAFASRHAWGRRVTYTSQALGPIDRGWRAKHKIAQRLGAEDSQDHDLPEKPPWMRWATYEKFAERYQAATNRIMASGPSWESLMAKFGD